VVEIPDENAEPGVVLARSVRRSPRLTRFVGTGVLLGVLLAFGCVLAGGTGSSRYATSGVLGYLAVTFGFLGALAGAGAAVLGDRAARTSRREARNSRREA